MPLFKKILFFRERGREGEIEGEKQGPVASHTPQLGTWPATQACTPPRNWVGHPLGCRPVLTEPQQLGQNTHFLILRVWSCFTVITYQHLVACKCYVSSSVNGRSCIKWSNPEIFPEGQVSWNCDLCSHKETPHVEGPPHICLNALQSASWNS